MTDTQMAISAAEGKIVISILGAVISLNGRQRKSGTSGMLLFGTEDHSAAAAWRRLLTGFQGRRRRSLCSASTREIVLQTNRSVAPADSNFTRARSSVVCMCKNNQAAAIGQLVAEAPRGTLPEDVS